MADDKLATEFARVVGFGEGQPRPRCPVHGVTLSSVFGCTLCDETENKASTSATAQEQESYFKVWEHQVLEEFDLEVARDRVDPCDVGDELAARLELELGLLLGTSAEQVKR